LPQAGSTEAFFNEGHLWRRQRHHGWLRTVDTKVQAQEIVDCREGQLQIEQDIGSDGQQWHWNYRQGIVERDWPDIGYGSFFGTPQENEIGHGWERLLHWHTLAYPEPTATGIGVGSAPSPLAPG